MTRFNELNGSYLAFVDRDSEAILATDPIRSWECYYTDAAGVRVFGTDAANVAQAIDNATLKRQTLAEVTHFGTAFNNRTPPGAVRRLPQTRYCRGV